MSARLTTNQKELLEILKTGEFDIKVLQKKTGKTWGSVTTSLHALERKGLAGETVEYSSIYTAK